MIMSVAKLLYIASFLIASTAVLVYSPLSFEDLETWRRSGIAEDGGILLMATILHLLLNGWLLRKGKAGAVSILSLGLGIVAALMLWLIFVTARYS